MGRLAAGAMALATAAVMATAGTAFAGGPPDGINWDHTYKATGVVVYVEEHGDIVSVCDTAANGHAAEVEVQDQAPEFYPPDYTIRATNGKGSCKTAQASDGKTYDMYEGDNVDLYFDGNTGTYNHTAEFLNDH